MDKYGQINDNAFSTEAMMQMAKSSEWIKLGAHTVWHTNAACESSVDLRQDLIANIRELKKWSNHDIDVFAYPYGDKGSFSDDAIEVVRQLGFKAAATTVPGYIDDCSNMYALNRITVQPGWRLAKFKFALKQPDLFYKLIAAKRSLIS